MEYILFALFVTLVSALGATIAYHYDGIQRPSQKKRIDKLN